ncbi:sensor histidine kinase [Paenibacillus harenae]|uniref:sensor histidine kinase n=1 Tax=Paenibacillus harenae TaxID=306543 RepID=UPI00041C06CD|nr:sensor histidine kinase [Paenibacillus harenae]
MQLQRAQRNSLYLPLRSKFIILFCLLITIPFLVIGAITYEKYSADVERSTVKLSYQIVNQIHINLERYVKEIERLTLMPLYDEGVMHILKQHSDFNRVNTYLTTDETNKMNLFISSLSFDRSEIESILIFTNDGSVFSNRDQSVRKQWDQSMSDWMAPVKEKDGGLTIIPPHDARYYVETKNGIVSISRVIREPYTNNMLGIVKVDLTSRGFETMLSSVSFGGSSQLRITNSEGDLIYAASDNVPYINESYLSASEQSDYTGLRVTAFIPRDEFRQDARALTRYTLIVSLLALMAAYAAAVILSNRLVKPIAHLQSKMRQVRRGLFQERAVVTTNDEIGQLTEGFNSMIGEIDRLVKEVYETRLREKEAELSALQSQIHPHFLYNTLETMNMLALQGNGPVLSNIVTSLGKLLRYTVDKQERLVHVLDEVKFAQAYLQIQAIRLGDKLQAAIHIDSSYDYCLVPKLILQPLIENVIEHAMGSGTVQMTLTASVEDDDLILTVKDNGIGISGERLKRLEEQLQAGSESRSLIEAQQGGFGTIKKGFALRNVHQRVRLHYGEPYGLFVDHKANCGAAFHIRLPIQWGE